MIKQIIIEQMQNNKNHKTIMKQLQHDKNTNNGKHAKW